MEEIASAVPTVSRPSIASSRVLTATTTNGAALQTFQA